MFFHFTWLVIPSDSALCFSDFSSESQIILRRKILVKAKILLVSPDFTCFATKQKYKIKGILKCHSRNCIYLISCKCCGKPYVGSTTGFKERFRIHKNDINTGKVRCGVANHLLNVCRSSASKFEYLQVQLIEKVSVQNDDDIEKVLWEREKSCKRNYLR